MDDSDTPSPSLSAGQIGQRRRQDRERVQPMPSRLTSPTGRLVNKDIAGGSAWHVPPIEGMLNEHATLPNGYNAPPLALQDGVHMKSQFLHTLSVAWTRYARTVQCFIGSKSETRISQTVGFTSPAVVITATCLSIISLFLLNAFAPSSRVTIPTQNTSTNGFDSTTVSSPLHRLPKKRRNKASTPAGALPGFGKQGTHYILLCNRVQ